MRLFFLILILQINILTTLSAQNYFLIPENITDVNSFKKQITFDLLLNKYQITPVLCYYLANNHSDSILVNNADFSKLRPTQPTQLDYLQYFLGKDINSDLFKDNNQIIAISDYFRKECAIGKLNRIEYRPNDFNINDLFLNNIISIYENKLNYLQCIVLTDIDTSKITFVEMLPPGFSISAAKEIIRKELSSGIVMDYFGNHIRAKGFKNIISLKKNPDSSFYEMMPFESIFHKQALYANADFYILIEIINLKFEYSSDPDDNNITKWKISKGSFHISLKNVISNNTIASIDLNNFLPVKSINTEKQGYINLTSTLLRDQIVSQMGIRSGDLVSPISYNGDFFRTFYKYLAQEAGSELNLYIHQFDVNINSQAIISVIESLKTKYDFEILNPPTEGNNNRISFIKTELIKCNFNIAEFKIDLDKELEKQLGISLKRIASPSGFCIYVEDQRPFRCVSDNVIIIYPKRIKKDYIWTDASKVTIYDQNFNSLPCNIIGNPSSDNNSITIKLTNGTFSNYNRYKIQISGVPDNDDTNVSIDVFCKGQ